MRACAGLHRLEVDLDLLSQSDELWLAPNGLRQAARAKRLAPNYLLRTAYAKRDLRIFTTTTTSKSKRLPSTRTDGGPTTSQRCSVERTEGIRKQTSEKISVVCNTVLLEKRSRSISQEDSQGDSRGELQGDSQGEDIRESMYDTRVVEQEKSSHPRRTEWTRSASNRYQISQVSSKPKNTEGGRILGLGRSLTDSLRGLSNTELYRTSILPCTGYNEPHATRKE